MSGRSFSDYPQFPSADEELRYVQQLLERERQAEEEEFRREWLSLPLTRRRALGITLYPLEFREATPALGERWKLRFDWTVPEGTAGQYGGPGHRFQSGQIVSIFRNRAEPDQKKSNEELQTLRGIVAEVRSSTITVVCDEAPDWLDDGRVGLDLVFQETTYREMERALRLWLDDRKLHARRDRWLAYAPLPGIPAGAADLNIEWAQLNAAQQRAVAGVAGLAAGDFAVIHGPPGTGKTTTLVAAIVTLLQRGERVLITAPTNAAADLLAERVLAAYVRSGAPGQVPLLRLGHPARISEEIHRHTLEGTLEWHPHSDARNFARYRAEADALYKKARKFRRSFGPAERAERQALLKEHANLRKQLREMERATIRYLLDSARAIVTTLVGSASQRLNEQEFDCVVLDEATQALEPAAWIALSRGAKIVLAGDHCQLPPTVKAAPELNHTLFEKMITRHADSGRVFFLDTQYRMQPEIVRFSNAAFYEDRLQTDESVLARENQYEFADGVEFVGPCVFVDTAGCDFTEAQDPDSDSYRNEGEARLLQALLANMLPIFRERSWSTGVIATYRNQVSHLRESFADSFADAQIEIDTVDAFQGRECDTILISLVRSNDAGETGFLSETRRMNVALTRARRLLVVVGDSATLSNHKFYDAFLKHVEEHGDYRSAYEFMEVV